MKKILIVDDDLKTLSGLTELFRQEGYYVFGTSSGQGAIGIAIREPIDIMVCDIRLPDIDGLVICRKLKQIRPDASIFVVTGFYQKQLEDVASFCGIKKYFSKPVNVNELLAAIQKYSNSNDPIAKNVRSCRIEC